METKSLATALAHRYKTRDPFRLANEMGYLVIYTPLEGIRGFYQYIKRCHIIYIDNKIDEQEAAFVCAHELGHSIIHKGYNRIFLDTHTFMPTGRYERDADRFAADLLFDDYDLQELMRCPITTVADSLGIDIELAEYRMRSVQPILFSEFN